MRRLLIASVFAIALTCSFLLPVSAAGTDAGLAPEDMSTRITETLTCAGETLYANPNRNLQTGSNFLVAFADAPFTGTSARYQHTFPLWDSASGGFNIGFEPFLKVSRLGTLDTTTRVHYVLAVWNGSRLYDDFGDPTHNIPAEFKSVELHYWAETTEAVIPLQASSVVAGNGGTFYLYDFDLGIELTEHVYDVTLYFEYDLVGFENVYALSTDFAVYGILPAEEVAARLDYTATDLLNFFDDPDLSFLDLQVFIAQNAVALAGWATFLGTLFSVKLIEIPVLICLALAIFTIFLSITSRLHIKVGDD